MLADEVGHGCGDGASNHRSQFGDDVVFQLHKVFGGKGGATLDEFAGVCRIKLNLSDLVFQLRGKGFELCIGLSLEHLNRGLHLSDLEADFFSVLVHGGDHLGRSEGSFGCGGGILGFGPELRWGTSVPCVRLRGILEVAVRMLEQVGVGTGYDVDHV